MSDISNAITAGVIYTVVGLLMIVYGLLALAYLPFKLMIKWRQRW